MKKILFFLFYSCLLFSYLPQTLAKVLIGAWSYDNNWTPALISKGQNYINIDPHNEIDQNGRFHAKLTNNLISQLKLAKLQHSGYQVFLGVNTGDSQQSAGIFSNSDKYLALANTITDYLKSTNGLFDGVILTWDPKASDGSVQQNFVQFAHILDSRNIKTRLYIPNNDFLKMVQSSTFLFLNFYIDKYELAVAYNNYNDNGSFLNDWQSVLHPNQIILDMATQDKYFKNISEQEKHNLLNNNSTFKNLSEYISAASAREIEKMYPDTQIVHDAGSGQNSPVTYLWAPNSSSKDKGSLILFNDDHNLDQFINYYRTYNLAGICFITQEGDKDGYYTNYVYNAIGK